MRKVRWLLIALGIVALAGCGSDDGAQAADGASSDVSTQEPASSDEDALRPSATFDVDAPLFTEWFGPVDPGAYRVDALGTPFTFTTDEQLFVHRNQMATFILTHPDSNGPGDRGIVVMRFSDLSDPTELIWPPEEAESWWPVDDFAGWLDNLADEVVVSNRDDDADLGGLDAVYAELQLGETDCDVGLNCTSLGMNHLIDGQALAPESRIRVWMVDQGDEDPLAVVVSVNREADVEWFDTANDVVSTFAFGAIGPNPVFEATGEVELDFLGGIRLDLAEPAVVLQEAGGYGATTPAFAQPRGSVEFLVAPNDANGEAVKTSDALLAVLEAAKVVVSELEPTDIGGLEARVFDFGWNSEQPLLSPNAMTDALWWPTPRGRMWLVEHPERGLLMITAEAFTDPDTVFPMILAFAEPVIESIEFIQLG